jgi:diacylglycerol kinase (ATP)
MSKVHRSPGRMASFRFAFSGIRQVLAHEPNMRIHFMAAIIVVVAGFLLHISRAEWAVVFLAFAAVITAEVFNTAIELLVDLVSPSIHPLAGKVKDISAAAVLIASFGAVFAGSIIFLPRILHLVSMYIDRG